MYLVCIIPGALSPSPRCRLLLLGRHALYKESRAQDLVHVWWWTIRTFPGIPCYDRSLIILFITYPCLHVYLSCQSWQNYPFEIYPNLVISFSCPILFCTSRIWSTKMELPRPNAVFTRKSKLAIWASKKKWKNKITTKITEPTQWQWIE